MLRTTVRLVLAQAGLQLAGDVGGEAAFDRIRAEHPDVVLVEDETGLVEELLTHQSDLGGIPIIKISLEDNVLHIYQRAERTMQRPGDLLETLQRVVGGPQ